MGVCGYNYLTQSEKAQGTSLNVELITRKG